jgi:hypothetical protein
MLKQEEKTRQRQEVQMQQPTEKSIHDGLPPYAALP